MLSIIIWSTLAAQWGIPTSETHALVAGLAGAGLATAGPEVLLLSTHGGIRAADGTPIALGYHTGHWEVGLLLEAAAGVFKAAGADAVPYPSH